MTAPRLPKEPWESGIYISAGGIFGGSGVEPLLLQCENNVLQILDAARQAIDPRDDQRISWTKEIQQKLQLGSSLAACSAGFLRPDHFAAGSAQCLLLQRQILIVA